MALIKTIEEVNDYADIGNQIDIEKLLPTINYVAESIIKPLIGGEQYTDITIAYDGDNLSETQTEFLKKIQSAVVKISISFYVNVAELTFTNNGLLRHEQGEYKTPFKYQKDSMQEYYLQRGYEAAETLLEFLEKNASTYVLWKDSEAYTVQRKFFINTAKDFSKYYEIRNSRVTFMRLHSAMIYAQEKISDLITSELSALLREEILMNTLSSDNLILVEDYLKNVFAYMTMDEALKDLSTDYVGDGILIYSFKSPSGKEAQPADGNQLAMKQSNIQVRLEYYTNKLIDFLKKQASYTKYASYFNSDQYEDPEGKLERIKEGSIYPAF